MVQHAISNHTTAWTPLMIKHSLDRLLVPLISHSDLTISTAAAAAIGHLTHVEDSGMSGIGQSDQSIRALLKRRNSLLDVLCKVLGVRGGRGAALRYEAALALCSLVESKSDAATVARVRLVACNMTKRHANVCLLTFVQRRASER